MKKTSRAKQHGKRKTVKRTQVEPAGKKTTIAATPAEPIPTPARSKKELVITLLQREDGATLSELVSNTRWQAHSVRGFLSGTLRKKLGLNIERATRNGECSYRITT